MMKKVMFLPVVIWLVVSVNLAAAETQELKITGPPNGAHLTYQTLEDGKLLVSVTDAQEKPLLGLTRDSFTIRRGLKSAKILSVEPLETSKEVALNIALVVDNSASMRTRKAIAPLSTALEAFYRTLRPIDTVSAIVFDERHTMTVDGRALHAKVMQTHDVGGLRRFLNESMHAGLTEGTYLYDAMMVGLTQVRKMPANSNKFLVVFSDGEDINSIVKAADVKKAARSIDGFSAFAVDYMPQSGINPFLKDFSTTCGGRAWKAASADELLPVFEAFSSILLHRYVVAYRFLEPPTGSLAFTSPGLTIEEVTTIDSAPLLNHIYFATGQSELSGDRYRLYANQDLTTGFHEKHLKGAMEKYRNVLNIIGRRLQNHPEATIRLVGCNSNSGVEKRRSDLSRSRAEAVRAYLRYIWGIDPARMAVEERNLPAAPSANRTPEGRAENQRVEIYSEQPAILDTVNSVYVQKVCDENQLCIKPAVQSEAGIADWQIKLLCGDHDIKTMQGQGALPGEWTIPLTAAMLDDISSCGTLGARMTATDHEANVLNTGPVAALPVKFVRRTEQMAQVQGYKVKEQYALILFDYDSAAIKARNQAVVGRIIARIKEVPDALVSIVGHTDTIGDEAYNVKLSERRAQAVRQAMAGASGIAADRLHVSGVGPREPLYDNSLPEGRSLNRTVTVTLEYLQKQ
jgi:outer membrane protein OmpA-like peptidoglycan-associated protein/Mg-chelatase subunit ChlD